MKHPFIMMVTALLLGVSVLAPLRAEDDRELSMEDLDPEIVEWMVLEEKAAEEEELTPEEEEKRQRVGFRVWSRFINAFMARYILEGEVVDQDGNALEGVQVRANKAKTRGPDRWVEKLEERRIDGAFSFDFDGYTVIHLYFDKEGYYPEKLSFGHNDAPTAEDILGREPPKRRNVVEDRNIRVVLEKIGDVTKLGGKTGSGNENRC